ncbi:AcrR family transcriptional regulator [Pelomonas saccharophila]|uniref:AcrR family transcriptional regulator n=1 Tax=Roseateles saccharophilus TaxID=304 RepID=A0ABU1YS88_ROSSA|nr:TetR/AcrR family transcriptional regulator [Roseateles saccharophilus]MDR7271719.1 AcrR family transcriptional regulator [Roseateles saccharophilus]
MSQASPPEAPRKPGRPPSEEARRLALATAYRILIEEGLGRLTIERVAAESGVSKPTIYRTWTNAQDLAMAAFMAHPPSDEPLPRAHSVRARLRAHLAGVIATFATPRGRQITLTMASADPDSELAKAFRNQVILKSREAGRQIIEAAMAAREIRSGIDIEVALDMIYGPLFFRLLVGHRPLSLQLAEQLVETLFTGVGAAPDSPG